MPLNHVRGFDYADAVERVAYTKARGSFSKVELQFSCAEGKGIQIAKLV